MRNRFAFPPMLALLLACSGTSAFDRTAAPGRMQILHCRMVNGAISLIERKEVPAKTRRPRAKPASAEALAAWPYAYALVSDSGHILSEEPLDDPALIRLEVPDSTGRQLRGHFIRRDTADFFVKVPAGPARIRFYRHPFPGDPLNKRGALKTPIAEFSLR